MGRLWPLQELQRHFRSILVNALACMEQLGFLRPHLLQPVPAPRGPAVPSAHALQHCLPHELFVLFFFHKRRQHC